MVLSCSKVRVIYTTLFSGKIKGLEREQTLPFFLFMPPPAGVVYCIVGELTFGSVLIRCDPRLEPFLGLVATKVHQS